MSTAYMGLDELMAPLQEHEKQLQLLRQQVSATEQKNSMLQCSLDDLSRQLQDSNDLQLHYLRERAKLEREIEIIQLEHGWKKQRAERELFPQLCEAQQQYDQRKMILQSVQNELNELVERFGESYGDNGKELFESIVRERVDRVEQEISELQKTVDAETAELTKQRSENDQLQQQVEDIEMQADTKGLELINSRNAVREAKLMFEEMQQKVQAQQANDPQRAKQARMEEQIQNLRARRQELQQSIQKEQAQQQEQKAKSDKVEQYLVRIVGEMQKMDAEIVRLGGSPVPIPVPHPVASPTVVNNGSGPNRPLPQAPRQPMPAQQRAQKTGQQAPATSAFVSATQVQNQQPTYRKHVLTAEEEELLTMDLLAPAAAKNPPGAPVGTFEGYGTLPVAGSTGSSPFVPPQAASAAAVSSFSPQVQGTASHARKFTFKKTPSMN